MNCAAFPSAYFVEGFNRWGFKDVQFLLWEWKRRSEEIRDIESQGQARPVGRIRGILDQVGNATLTFCCLLLMKIIKIYFFRYKYDKDGSDLSLGLNGSPFTEQYALLSWRDTAEQQMKQMK